MAEICHWLQKLKGDGWQFTDRSLRKLGKQTPSNECFFYILYSQHFWPQNIHSSLVLPRTDKECNKQKANKHHLLIQNDHLSFFSIYHEKNTAFFPIVYKQHYTWKLWIHILLPLGSKDSSNQDNLSAPSNMPAPDLISSTLCFASTSAVSTEVAAEPGARWLAEITRTEKNKIKKRSNPLRYC